MVVDKSGKISYKEEKVDLVIIVFDATGSFKTYLPVIRNVHFCNDIERHVRLLYQSYLSKEFPQKGTICKVFFAYEHRVDLDYYAWTGGIIQLKNYNQTTTLFFSSDGININDFKHTKDELA